MQAGELLWSLVCDNLNFTLRKGSQRLHNLTEQINATTAAVIALPACLTAAVFENTCSSVEFKRKAGGRQEMSLHKLVPTHDQQKQLRKAFCHAVRSLLLDNLPGLAGRTKRVKRIKRKVASEKLTIRQVDGAGEKTEFYPLRMLDEEESSIRGTIRVVQCLLRDILGLTTEVASSALRFVIGDWLTARNLRLMKYIRMMEPESWGRMDWVQEASMPFHFQLNAVYMIIRTHLGDSERDHSCLDRHRTRLRRYKLDKKKPDYHKAQELIEHSLIARLLDIAR